ncbi:hypothetical protein IQ260_24260 [Leptolyngbya cf. ectocarpi LEGE 11479]|uniref:TonB family protein n=1 Tax=Leptolyngbya cf. ectocarpi LEGE 11479 TaxID=1828722 RepID=A0A928ZYG0_LEPEC|nr:hypothetical protein [Leptolyngbya ectocarpi]MBE9069761.1 hypothetical protein [Leptolyngbya cf. ectocarpi LEGE 11479]
MNFLKVLFNPIFLLAVGLHAGLLMIPVAGGSSENVVPAPDPEGESITVTRIPPKRDKSAKPGASQSPPSATRPTAVGQAANSKKATAAVSARSQTKPRSQGDQRSSRSSSSTNGDSSGETSNIQNTSAAPSENPAGLPDLPDNTTTDSVPVTVSSNEVAEQKAPTLIALRAGADTRSVPQRLQEFLARLQYSLQGTRDVAAAQTAWLAKLEEQSAGLSAPQELEKPLEISYPVTITEEEGPRQIYSCLSPLPKQGLIGAVVDADGAIATEPALLRSSGYPFLNDVALQKIQDYENFPTENTQKIYTVPFDVNYDEDACLSLADISAADTSED